MKDPGLSLCRASIARHSKSFALARHLLPAGVADRAAVLYAWCRRADDAVDRAPREAQAAALERLREELELVYSGAALGEPELAAFQRLVHERRLPRAYAEELLAGMEMDRAGARYATLDDLLVYCFRVAGVVGLMMCHVLEPRHPRALRRAAHLGIAMQLTNVCRDVLEDWDMGRLYLPEELLAACGAPGLIERRGGPFPSEARSAVAEAVRRLLAEAELYYRSGDRGLADLPWRAALAVRTARSVYAAIGRRIEAQGCDVAAGRAFVPFGAKLGHAGRAGLLALAELPARAARRLRTRLEPGFLAGRVLRFPDDVLPLLSD
jgi:phytoene synthase